LIVDVREHGTVVGTDDPVNLEFEDCVNAITGLTDWLARALAEVNPDAVETIGSAMLIEALHQWTFNEQVDASGETGDLEDEEDEEDEDGFEDQ
jgi:predicted metal-dependent TIM-barrel fold hydrolase